MNMHESNKPHICDSLRNVGSITQKDSRYNETLTIESMLQHLDGTDLHSGVHKDVATHFETTRNLYLYSFYNYRFGMVAEMHAYASIELALKEQLPSYGIVVKKGMDRYKSLGVLLYDAFSKDVFNFKLFHDYDRKLDSKVSSKLGLLKNSGLGFTQQSIREIWANELEQEYKDTLRELITRNRNNSMHGSKSLAQPWAFGLIMIRYARDIINQLYPEATHEDKSL